MDVIFYYYYLFYTKIIKDDEPFATTCWALSASEGFFSAVMLHIFFTRFFCFQTSKWMMVIPTCLFLLINYLYFNKSGRSRKIVKEKPMFFSSHKLSVALTLLFFIATFSTLIWGAVYARYLTDTYCR